jgi:hypothetical protein
MLKILKFFSALSLLSVFNNYTPSKTLNSSGSSNFQALHGFGMIFSTANNTYYVVDYHGNRIFILNDNWEYINSITSFDKPTCMIVVNNSIYISGDRNVWKTDIHLLVISQYNATNITLYYRGIYVDSVKSLVYVVVSELPRIDVFDSNLSLNDSISISDNPWSITAYNNQLIVGTSNGKILTIVNKTTINTFNGCNGNTVALTSIIFDDYGYMATCCDSSVNQVFLYYLNGTFTGKNISTPSRPFKIGFDSKNIFYILSLTEISLYN